MPANETEAYAQIDQTDKTENTAVPGFDAAAFKSQLMLRIQALTPTNAKDADEFKESNGLDGIKGELNNQVTAEKEQSKAPLSAAITSTPDTGRVPTKSTAPLPEMHPGELPAPIEGVKAAPKPRSAAEVEQPLVESSQALDVTMASAGLSEAQLAQSNEPTFLAAFTAKESAQAQAKESAVSLRSIEQDQLLSAKAEAVTASEHDIQAMHKDRTLLFEQVEGNQETTKSNDEQARQEVATEINRIYHQTKIDVETTLEWVDSEVDRTFDEGADTAQKVFEEYIDAEMEAYKEARYGNLLGWAQWLIDKLLPTPPEVLAIYNRGRNLFIGHMEAVINNVVAIVGQGISEAKAKATNGRYQMQTYIAQLPPALQDVGNEATKNIQDKFDELEKSIDGKQNALIDSLANKYQEHLQAIDIRIEEMKAANFTLFDMASSALGGVVATVLELKEMLLNVLSRAAEAVNKIIQTPIEFLDNLLSAINQGFQQFSDNINTHMEQGFVSWLTGTLNDAGIILPETFDLTGIFQLIMQILGISAEKIVGKVSEVLGIDILGIYGQIEELINLYQLEGLAGLAKYGLEKLIGIEGVEALLEVLKIVEIIKSGDLGQLWELIQEHLSNLKEMVFGKIQEFLVERVVKAGITWVISLFSPAGAFIRACKMIYDVVMFFIERGSQIASLVNAVIESVTSIATGNISGAANFVEQALARSVPVAIGFLSSLLGLGNISGKIQEAVESVRTAVDNGIDKILQSKPVQLVAGFIKEIISRTTTFAKNFSDHFGIKDDTQPFEDISENHHLASAEQDDSHYPSLNEEFVFEMPGPTGHTYKITPKLEVIQFSKPTKIQNEQAFRVKLELLKTLVPDRPNITYPIDDLGRPAGPRGYIFGRKSTGMERANLPKTSKLRGYQKGDHRGHLIGDRFMGIGDESNLVPMHSNLNQGSFKKIEDEIDRETQKLIENHQQPAFVYMSVTPNYTQSDKSKEESYRPKSIIVSAKIITLKIGSLPAEILVLEKCDETELTNHISGPFHKADAEES